MDTWVNIIYNYKSALVVDNLTLSLSYGIRNPILFRMDLVNPSSSKEVRPSSCSSVPCLRNWCALTVDLIKKFAGDPKRKMLESTIISKQTCLFDALPSDYRS